MNLMNKDTLDARSALCFLAETLNARQGKTIEEDEVYGMARIIQDAIDRMDSGWQQLKSADSSST